MVFQENVDYEIPELVYDTDDDDDTDFNDAAEPEVQFILGSSVNPSQAPTVVNKRKNTKTLTAAEKRQKAVNQDSGKVGNLLTLHQQNQPVESSLNLRLQLRLKDS